MITMGVNYKFGSGARGASGSPGHEKYPDTDEGKENLAKDAQNPIADLISVPFQNNTNFNVGPFNRAQNVLNIQPVVPLHLSNAPGTQWTVPLGGGIGRVFKVAGQAFNAQTQAFYNVVRAGPGSISTPGDWQFRFEVSLLFPE